jgi:hypothetical protein
MDCGCVLRVIAGETGGSEGSRNTEMKNGRDVDVEGATGRGRER